jgi:hypothetical protein
MWALVRSYKMDNVRFEDIEQTGGKFITYAIIDLGDGAMVCMTKEHYEESLKPKEQSGTL